MFERLTEAALLDGTVELELAVSAERSFPGIAFRIGAASYESFFVRPHQVGNPDSIQYTPCFNGVSSWQLYHGDGFGAAVSFPLGDWFTIRVVFAGTRAELYVADLEAPALVSRLRIPPAPGRVGIEPGGADLQVARFEHEVATAFRSPPRGLEPEQPGVIRSWEVSDPFAEAEVELADERTWTAIEAEPAGLLDLARVHGLEGGRNTVLARTTIQAERAQTQQLDFGFSDRARVFLNGVPLYRGDDTYRSRDYRFLGSIGWHDTVYLPLEAGENELSIAVSEDFGGWGVQARLG